jgi:hypothetical protein
MTKRIFRWSTGAVAAVAVSSGSPAQRQVQAGAPKSKFLCYQLQPAQGPNPGVQHGSVLISAMVLARKHTMKTTIDQSRGEGSLIAAALAGGTSNSLSPRGIAS